MLYVDWDGMARVLLFRPPGLLVNATPFTESLKGLKKEPYGIGVEQNDIDGDSNGEPCCGLCTLWFTSEVQTENEYIRKKTPLAS